VPRYDLLTASPAQRLGDFSAGKRLFVIAGLALPIGAVSAGVAWLLLRLIGLITNGVFYQRFDTSLVAPDSGHHNPALILLAPVAGGLVIGKPEIGPRPLLIARDEAGIEEQLQMARDARLRLAEHIRQVADREVAARQHQEDTQPTGFGGRLQGINHGIEANRRARQHLLLQKDIKISLCEYRPLGKSHVAFRPENDAREMIG